MIDQITSGDVQASYDCVAAEYVARIYDELQHKPLDRELLDRFADRVRDLGTVCDMGCGPGHVARYLHERGVHVFGLDLSHAMLEHARRLNPAIEFRQGNMLSLDLGDGSCAGVVAFYSLIHIPRHQIVDVLRELRRLLQPGGLLFVAFHIGEGAVHLVEWWGHKVSIDFLFFQSDEMVGYLNSAGFEVEEVIERHPYPDVEHPSRRAYIFVTRAD
jgi:SAM-dependent methyltransferase